MPPGVFTIRLEHGWWFGRVVGFCIDHEPALSGDPSRIRGWVKGNTLRFKKVYRSSWVRTANGPKHLRESLSETGFTTQTELPGQQVFYVGTFDAQAQIAKGTWRLVRREVLIRANGEDFVVPAGESSGTWTMKKLEDKA